MSRLFPHPAYAEDQPLSHTILTTHVLHRGFQLGSLLGATTGLTYSTYRYFRPSTPSSSPSPSPSPAPSQSLRRRLFFLPTTLRTTGIGGTAGLGLIAIGLVARMWGREEVEWQDRAWRLLENEGQASVDEWSLAGMVVAAGLAVAAARRGVIVLNNKPLAVVGAAGLGSLVGTEGSVEWRALRGTSVRKEEKVQQAKPEKRLLEE